jgi:immune inhibitor A
VLASSDGRKWDILPGQQTTTDNPTGASFGHAYTGEPVVSDNAATPWVVERFDLSRYAGEQIWVRFEYVTDDAIHHTGWFIDEVRIPAIRYATDFERGADGWEGDGWLLSDNRFAQRWLVQVLEFEGDRLVQLRRIQVDAAGRAQVEIANLSDTRDAVLAISALALVPSPPARYELKILSFAGR